jgi:hypothetical protein
MGGAVGSQATRAVAARRAYWLKHLHAWHWISSAVCLVGMLLFAVTGITLNHAADIETAPAVTTAAATLPESLRAACEGDACKGHNPPALASWASSAMAIDISRGVAEWTEPELYVSLPRAGGDAWLSIDMDSGEARYELTDRGWIAYLNDLHKGRNTGVAWRGFLDVFAVACVVFTLTGLFLLQLHAGHRPTTWPVVGLGLIVPVLLALLLIH